MESTWSLHIRVGECNVLEQGQESNRRPLAFFRGHVTLSQHGWYHYTIRAPWCEYLAFELIPSAASILLDMSVLFSPQSLGYV